jgi:ribonuclease P protein component
MTAKRTRLSRSSDFERVYRQGSSVASRFLVLYYFRQSERSADAAPRLGLSVSKKLGGAVVRNRVKRHLREAFRASAERVSPDYDYVVIARPQVLELIDGPEKGAVAGALGDLLRRAGLLATDAGDESHE